MFNFILLQLYTCTLQKLQKVRFGIQVATCIHYVGGIIFPIKYSLDKMFFFGRRVMPKLMSTLKQCFWRDFSLAHQNVYDKYSSQSINEKIIE